MHAEPYRRVLRVADERAAGPLGAAGTAPAGNAAVPRAHPIAVLLLLQSTPRARAWCWSRLVLGARALRGVPGLRFARVLGSGRDGGFGLTPGFDRHGVFALFDDDVDADAFIDRSPLAAAYRAGAAEMLVAKLRATTCKGCWGGVTMQVTQEAHPDAPVAALTRGSIRPSRALAFWRHAAPSQAQLREAHGCELAVGLGEAPLLRQATFSVWADTAAMNAYARQAAHLQAIRAARDGAHFSESMFVRLLPSRLEGVWHGRRYG